MTMTSVDPPAQPKSVRLRLALARPPGAGFGFRARSRRARPTARPSRSARSTLSAIGMKPSAVPLFTAAIVAGSALGVYPAG